MNEKPPIDPNAIPHDSGSNESYKEQVSQPHPNPESIQPTIEPGLYEDAALQKIHTRLRVEKEDQPSEGLAPIPLFLIFLFAIMMFWSGFYLNRYSGDFRSDVFYPEWRPGTGETAQAAVPFDPIKQGQKRFMQICQQCHQPTGLGVPGVYPPLKDSEWALGDEARLIKVLLAGMNGPLTVHGHTFNGNMPSFGQWKDQDIAAVLTYVRQEWGNKAPEIKEETVKKIREIVGKRTQPWKPEELIAEHPF
jgi:mono/diheme cytochrome c family protein